MHECKLSLLLIENDRSDLDLFTYALQATNLKVHLSTVAHAEAAKNYILGEGIYLNRQQYPFPDIIVLALLLPVLSGVDFLKWCTQTRVCARVPLVVLTGAMEGETKIQEALQNRADRLYLKSASFQNLTTIVREIFYFGMESREQFRPGKRHSP